MDTTLKNRAFAEWRGLPFVPERRDRSCHVGEPLAAVMKKLGLSERLVEAEVRTAWRELVGDFIAQHSAPDRLAGGVLYVQVLQPTLHYELNRVWKPKILQKFKQRFGAKTIREIRFRVS